MKRHNVARSLLLALLLLVPAGVLAAQGAETSAQAQDFRFTVTPYAWLTGLSGTVGARGSTATVNTSFADLSKYLNTAAMLDVDVLYRERVGFLADLNYSQLGDQVSGKVVSLDSKSTLLLSDLTAYYRLWSAAPWENCPGSVSLDLLAGARIWSLGMSLDANTFFGGRSITETKTWADPVVGARAQFHLGEKWAFELRGGVGGFGVSSSLTWDAMALVGYHLWDHGTLFLGYRGVGVNHTEGSGSSKFVFDTTLHGPILGLAFSF
jgi:hypothetical protein